VRTVAGRTAQKQINELQEQFGKGGKGGGKRGKQPQAGKLDKHQQ
jgi:hypothetical protein